MTMVGKRAVVRRLSKARSIRGHEEVVGHIYPATMERVAALRIEHKLSQAARARRIAEARVRTDRRGLRGMWRRRISA